MPKKFLVLSLCLIMSLAVVGACFAQLNEQVTITTYYPSPYGVYKNLRIFPSGTGGAPPTCNSNQEGVLYSSGAYTGGDITQTNTLYYCNGTNWVAQGGGGGAGACIIRYTKLAKADDPTAPRDNCQSGTFEPGVTFSRVGWWRCTELGLPCPDSGWGNICCRD